MDKNYAADKKALKLIFGWLLEKQFEVTEGVESIEAKPSDALIESCAKQYFELTGEKMYEFGYDGDCEFITNVSSRLPEFVG